MYSLVFFIQLILPYSYKRKSTSELLNILDKLDMLFNISNLSNVFTYHLSNYIFAEFHGLSHCP